VAINRYRFYIGPVGYMVPLPPHKRSPSLEATRDYIGQLQESLSGRRTLDIRAFKKTWSLDWDWRKEDELRALLRPYLGYANIPMRFLDPRSRNLLPLNVSTGGSELQDVDGFTRSGAGVLSYVADASMPLELQGELSGEIQLATAVTGNTLTGTAETLPMVYYSKYLFSAYVKGSGTWAPCLQELNTAGTVVNTVFLASPVTLSSTWQLVQMSYVPDGTYPQLYFGLRCATAGTVQTTGWQVQIDEYLRRPWMPGDGCPEVVVSKLQKKYQVLGRSAGVYTPQLTLNATILEA
jgi:hypothetical protein